MNNAIVKTLTLQALDHIESIGKGVTSTDFVDKLVELVVKECLAIVEPDVHMECGDEWYTTLHETAQEIKSHFGVK